MSKHRITSTRHHGDTTVVTVITPSRRIYTLISHADGTDLLATPSGHVLALGPGQPLPDEALAAVQYIVEHA